MSETGKFLIVKEKDSKEIKYFDYDKIDGYNLIAKDNAHFQDAIDINRMIIINPSFTEKIATKKLELKFEKLINMAQIVCEMDEEDETGEGYRIVLDEANKLRTEMWNKYKKFISEEKFSLMCKKIEIIEGELKLRRQILFENIEKKQQLENQKGKAR